MVSFAPRPLYPWGKSPGNQWIGGWVGPRAGLDDVEKRKFLTLPGINKVHLKINFYVISKPGFLLLSDFVEFNI
jgi:hypothetical protein